MADLNGFNIQKDLFYKGNPNATDDEFYARPEIRKYTQAYQDEIVKLGENSFTQYEYKVELPKEGKILIVSTDYEQKEDGSRILTQMHGGIENCYVSFLGRVQLSNRDKLVRDCEESRSHVPSKKACFIATATYGDISHPNVDFLRQYRDQVLDKYWIGRRFITVYYLIGPYLASPVKYSKKINTVTKLILDLLVNYLKK